ncbi:MAG: hypothetical protein KAR20_21415, partial [Candidatus Heimdallarchaeota archaeon]|nr:hypothetical protein [Candidatus Heimdallarchaeota archaeon]
VQKFGYVGKASYHILLTQMLMFGIATAIYGEHYFTGTLQAHFQVDSSTYSSAVWIYTITMWLICVPIGIGWFLTERWILNKKKGKLIVLVSDNDAPIQ